MSIIQLSELLENYNFDDIICANNPIIQLSELLENYNAAFIQALMQSIIQLSELLENYNEKSAHLWVGNFSLQILTDLHPSKTPRMANLLFLARVSAFGLECRLPPMMAIKTPAIS